MSVAGKRVLVVGLGISGFWASRWLMEKGAQVTVTESRKKEEVNSEFYADLADRHCGFEMGGHHRETFLNADLIIVSPGVPHTMPFLLEAREKGVPMMGELELASRIIPTPLIAITGTNGKSTVTACLGSLLEKAGVLAYVGGNIGTPLIAYACGEMNAEYLVVEVSSFQLDTAENLSPYISIILNISPDHLDRYQDFEEYWGAKKKIFSRQGPGQYLIMNNEDEVLAGISPETGVSILRYGLKKRDGQAAYLQDGIIRARGRSGEMVSYPVASFRLPGDHNILNLEAVILVGHILEIDPATIQASLSQFQGLPHRLERVGEKNGIVFYNDSKATNVEAALEAIQSLACPIILIAGGKHKGLRYDKLAAASAGRVKKAIFIGEARENLARAFEGVVPYHLGGGLDEAVRLAFTWAEPGDAVLLSPACSSFDLFQDYRHRGEVFRTAVERLIHD
jgi:UDP-N-acetylmuramoylalanine--D-glutamate ligase